MRYMDKFNPRGSLRAIAQLRTQRVKRFEAHLGYPALLDWVSVENWRIASRLCLLCALNLACYEPPKDTSRTRWIVTLPDIAKPLRDGLREIVADVVGVVVPASEYRAPWIESRVQMRRAGEPVMNGLFVVVVEETGVRS